MSVYLMIRPEARLSALFHPAKRRNDEAVVQRDAGGPRRSAAQLPGVEPPGDRAHGVHVARLDDLEPGAVSNSDHANVSIGKAGRARWMGIRPTIRGVAMNPIDHPHGGGEGKTSGGRHPVSPWAVQTKGYKTRKNKRTNKDIIRRRTKKTGGT